MSIGRGIVISSMWGCVAVVGVFSNPVLAGVLGICALIATIAIA